jgi:hypothetical protein
LNDVRGATEKATNATADSVFMEENRRLLVVLRGTTNFADRYTKLFDEVREGELY